MWAKKNQIIDGQIFLALQKSSILNNISYVKQDSIFKFFLLELSNLALSYSCVNDQ